MTCALFRPATVHVHAHKNGWQGRGRFPFAFPFFHGFRSPFPQVFVPPKVFVEMAVALIGGVVALVMGEIVSEGWAAGGMHSVPCV